jgi:hypothetical protein
MSEAPLFSAQVALKLPASNAGASIERAQRAFAGMGFEIGHLVGNSFAITATAPDFRHAFGVALAQRPNGGVNVDGGPCPQDGLPLQGLPDSLRALVQAVLFSEPPAFGPGAP